MTIVTPFYPFTLVFSYMINYHSFDCVEYFGADFPVWCGYLQNLEVFMLVLIPRVSVLFDAKSVIVHR